MKTTFNNSADKKYRFGFVLTTTIGNLTRYENLKKYAERDGGIKFLWAPVNHYLTESDKFYDRLVPNGIRLRVYVLKQALPLFRQLDSLDAVMIHLFEADTLLPLRRYIKKTPLLFSSTDEAPIVDRQNYPLYPNDLKKPIWRQKLRLAIDLWRVRNIDQFIPFSGWVANILISLCAAPPECVHPIHVGLDLELWPRVARDTTTQKIRKEKLLFVGGDFIRKGGDLLLNVFKKNFSDRAELHMVSMQAPHTVPDNVHVYRDFRPNDPRLRALYADCDILIIPTTADTGPLWVFMEAMASSMPVIGTDTGSNSELVRNGDTGYIVPIGDEDALANAISTLLHSPDLRAQMGQRGRALIESQYSAAVNVPKILQVMKDAVDARRKT